MQYNFPYLKISFLVSVLLGLSIQAHAAIYTVTTTNDFSDPDLSAPECGNATLGCSFRAAIEQANFNAGFDTVNLMASTHLLTNGVVPITDSLAIRGISKNSSRIRPAVGVKQGIIEIKDAAFVSLSDATFSHANAAQGLANRRSAIVVRANSFLYAYDINVVDNTAFGYPASGIYNLGGTVYLHRLYAANNVIDPSIINNPSVRDRNRGGAINTSSINGVDAETWISDSTIENNSATFGGAIFHNSLNGGTYIDNSTITNNTVPSDGAGASLFVSSGRLYLAYSFVDGNPQGATAANIDISTSAMLVAGGSVLSGPAKRTCKTVGTSGFVLSMGGNVFDTLDTSKCTAITFNDTVGTFDQKELSHQLIMPGPGDTFTPTAKPVTSLPWVDNGQTTLWIGIDNDWFFNCSTSDQRGAARNDWACDSGAYEQ